MQSELCECSDPKEWMVYHHGESPGLTMEGMDGIPPW